MAPEVGMNFSGHEGSGQLIILSVDVGEQSVNGVVGELVGEPAELLVGAVKELSSLPTEEACRVDRELAVDGDELRRV